MVTTTIDNDVGGAKGAGDCARDDILYTRSGKDPARIGRAEMPRNIIDPAPMSGHVSNVYM
jgi:hypothetical protein